MYVYTHTHASLFGATWHGKATEQTSAGLHRTKGLLNSQGVEND